MAKGKDSQYDKVPPIPQTSEYGAAPMPESFYGPLPSELDPPKPIRPVPPATNPYGVLPGRRPQYDKVPAEVEVPGDLTQQIKAIEAAPVSAPEIPFAPIPVRPEKQAPAAESIYERIPDVLFKDSSSKESISNKDAVKEIEFERQKSFAEALSEKITLKNLAIALAVAVAAAAIAAACVFAFPAVAAAVAAGATAVGVSGLSTAALAGAAAGVVGGLTAVGMAAGAVESALEKSMASEVNIAKKDAAILEEKVSTPHKQQPAMQVNMADLQKQAASHAAGVVSSKAAEAAPGGPQQTAVQRLQEQQGKANGAARNQ